MNKKIIIRKAKIKDLDVLSKMSFELLKYHQKFDKYFSPSREARKHLKEFQKKCIYSRKFYLLVAELDGKLMGYSLSAVSSLPPIFRERKVGFINDVYVVDGYRKKGIAKSLLEETYKWLKEKNIKNVQLSVHSMNNLGKKAWEKSNFKIISHKMHRKI